MAIDDNRARERYDKLREMLDQSRRHIEWLLPFLNAKAKESGNTAGLQMNAREHAEGIKALLRSYDAEDSVAASDLAAPVTAQTKSPAPG